jgi:hypothetical protein
MGIKPRNATLPSHGGPSLRPVISIYMLFALSVLALVSLIPIAIYLFNWVICIFIEVATTNVG